MYKVGGKSNVVWRGENNPWKELVRSVADCRLKVFPVLVFLAGWCGGWEGEQRLWGVDGLK